jgi:hypothetical protein
MAWVILELELTGNEKEGSRKPHANPSVPIEESLGNGTIDIDTTTKIVEAVFLKMWNKEKEEKEKPRGIRVKQEEFVENHEERLKQLVR